jgi:hypothetical protein
MGKITERRYDLRLDIKDPDVPFSVGRSIAASSGDLVQVFSMFQIELVRLLRELHEEEMMELRLKDDDIPF